MRHWTHGAYMLALRARALCPPPQRVNIVNVSPAVADAVLTMSQFYERRLPMMDVALKLHEVILDTWGEEVGVHRKRPRVPSPPRRARRATVSHGLLVEAWQEFSGKVLSDCLRETGLRIELRRHYVTTKDFLAMWPSLFDVHPSSRERGAQLRCHAVRGGTVTQREIDEVARWEHAKAQYAAVRYQS